MLSSVNLLCYFGFSPQFSCACGAQSMPRTQHQFSRSRSISSAAPFAKSHLRCFPAASQQQFSRAIRKVAPAVLSRCFAANFAHKPALSPCISTNTKMCKHILCCLCLCMAELLQNDYILKRFCLQSHILIIDLVIFNQYNREGKRRRIEAVITGRTRNALALRGTRVRIPPSPLGLEIARNMIKWVFLAFFMHHYAIFFPFVLLTNADNVSRATIFSLSS